MNVMEKNAEGPDKLGFIDRDLYNHVSVQKKRKIEGSDARYLLTYMIAQKKQTRNSFSNTQKTKKAI